MPRFFLILSLTLISSLSFGRASRSTLPAPQPWPVLASRLTGESDNVRNRSIDELRKTPNLPAILRSALKGSGTEKFLALDVVSTLRLDSMLPDILKLSEKEPSGYFYHTINTMVTDANRGQIVSLYRKRVLDKRAWPAARMAMLDTLARFGSELSVGEVESMLKDPQREMSSCALSYVRAFLLQGRRGDYLPLVLERLRDGPYLIRVQAIYLMREQRFDNDWRDMCHGDKDPKVRALCTHTGRA